MKSKTILAALAMLFSIALPAQEWIDVTNAYVTNPRFDNGTNGWTLAGGAPTKATGWGGFEFYNGTFDIQQRTNVPAGRYRVSVQTYFRYTDNDWAYSNYETGNDPKSAFLYANHNNVPIVSIYSEPLTEYSNGCWSKDNKYYPNNMESGAHAFSTGRYWNHLEVEVSSGENLTFGLSCEESYNSMWCMMDNFKLEKYGTVTQVNEIQLSKSDLTMELGEVVVLKATILPNDATYQKLSWSSSASDVVTVDASGKLTAVGSGVATITASATDNSGVKATCKVKVNKTEIEQGALIINELQAANIDMFVDPSFNYGSWIELYNTTNKTVSLQGLYVSDDPDNLKQHKLTSKHGVVPANGYKVLWFDHHSKWAVSQLDSKLNYDGGTIYISNSDGEILCSQTYPEAITRTSYARTNVNSNEWAVSTTPTPGKSNDGSTFATQRLEAPVIDKASCLFSSSFNIQITIPEGSTLRYTTDGTTPTEVNGSTNKTGRFVIDRTSILRFRLFQNGYLPSRVVTRSYIREERDFGLPFISVVSDPDHFYDDSLGIFVKGVNGRTGNGQSTPCNWNMDWERPVNFEYVTKDGEMVINQEANIEICGGWSRAWEPHSFKIKANKIYEGENFLPYQFFPNKPFLKHKTLQIRNGGNDTGSRIKDAALQTIVHSSGLDVEGQECQPVVHYVNGVYKGVLNIREPNNKHYVEANYALEDDEIDQFEMSPDSNYVQKCGTNESFLRWYDLSANASNAATYEEICRMVDIDEYINYLAVEFYLGGTDWPQNNIKGFKPRTEDGKFRFVLYDLDGAFATTDVFNTFEWKKNYTFDYIYDTNSRISGEIKWVTIFLNMLKNDKFRKQFIDTYCLVAGSVFEPERCNAIIDSMARNTERALGYEGCSPWGTANNLKSNLVNRQNNMINTLRNYNKMNLSNVNKMIVSLATNISQARLSVNGLQVPTNKFSGSLFAPITLKAEAPAGYRFLGWINQENASETFLITKGSSWSYYDKGSQDGQDWKSSVNKQWATGKAPLGYYTSDNNNGRGYNTFLEYGNDASNKRPTYYFIKEVNLDYTPSTSDIYTLNYVIDDGMIVYVNGQEATRYLMPNGEVNFNTYASSYAGNNPDNGSLILPADLFKKGKNIIAVEVHNNSSSSTDIYFDVELKVKSPLASGKVEYLSTEEEFVLPNSNHFNLIACYEPVSEEEMLEAHAVPVRINEISANNSIYVNATYFKKNDWIELYNTTNKPVDVEGMYLTDKENNPYKYQIVGDENINTVIAPYGYLIVWADKLTPIQQLHTTFKLDNEGGCVMLTAEDKSWSDIIHYPEHAGNMSVGLYPDGGMKIYLMNTPSIGATNQITSYSEYLSETIIPDGLESVELSSNAILYAIYTDGHLRIVGQESSHVDVWVYTTAGQQLMHKPVSLVDGQGTTSIDNLPTGIYIIRLQDRHGNISNQKLVIK